MSEKFLLFFLALLKKFSFRAASNFGAALGLILWTVSFKRVNKLERRCVGALGVGITTARGIICASYKNMGRVFAEFFNIKSRADVAPLVEFVGEEHLIAALAGGKGVIIMLSHLANWELVAALGCEKGYKLNAIYTPQRNTAGAEDAFRHQRDTVCGMGLVSSESGGIKQAFSILKRGEILAVFQDLDARDDGIKSTFLGLPASTHVGIFKLSKHFGSPVIPIQVVRENNGKYSAIFYPPLHFEEDMENFLAMCNNVIEAWVKEHPDQWLWILDRWGSVLS